MFDKLLIANRGEIACRVIRSAKGLGIETIAVYSEADAKALHVSQADQAIAIGPAPAEQSYLDADKLVAAARHAGADAVHPGYGFLAENADFAKACAEHGIVFVGPPPAAIAAMGSKVEARRIMQQAGVPLTPGCHGTEQDEATLLAEAEKIGFPVMLKAALGGGGRGMREVASARDFGGALKAARREARAAFGDDEMLLEKLVPRPRHVEIQVFCDHHGNAAHLFERDCSIQRRHQKVLEEAPAPGLDEKQRAALGQLAIAAARAINYAGAGTVEFIMDEDGAFYFMEMNTRLQVEHPVTELITGQDLVEWQLKVAAGEPLPATSEQLALRGHALEARLYAEDPGKGFLPATGRLNRLRFPEESVHVRVDAGVRQGDVITMHYDPMMAKLIVWDEDRARCLQRMSDALRQTEVDGVATNIGFLAAVVAHPAFRAADIDTGFIERHRAELLPDGDVGADAEQSPLGKQKPTAPPAPASPWEATDNWWLNLPEGARLSLSDETGGQAAAASRAADRQPGATRLLAPMPGRIIEITAAEGQQVKEGDTLLILEAMKMEHAVAAPCAGVLEAHRYAVGDIVAEQAELLLIRTPGP